jgi:N-acetylglutamate synthase-like GNAT family acetyltransferase
VNLQIRRARPDDAETLTAIAHAAKRHWGYPEHWIEHWEPELTITPDFISRNEVFVAVIDEEIIGCCALVLTESLAELEHMWIMPEYIGTGVGRALFLHTKERAASLKVRELGLSADPNAEGFYKRMGAIRIGEVRSEIDGQPRLLPRMKVGL